MRRRKLHRGNSRLASRLRGGDGASGPLPGQLRSQRRDGYPGAHGPGWIFDRRIPTELWLTSCFRLRATGDEAAMATAREDRFVENEKLFAPPTKVCANESRAASN